MPCHSTSLQAELIFKTHNIALTQDIADFVVSLSSDGRVLTQGTMSDALRRSSKLRLEAEESRTKEEKTEGVVDEPAAEPDKSKDAGKLTVAEDISEGHVRWPALKLYVTALGGVAFWMGY